MLTFPPLKKSWMSLEKLPLEDIIPEEDLEKEIPPRFGHSPSTRYLFRVDATDFDRNTMFP